MASSTAVAATSTSSMHTDNSEPHGALRRAQARPKTAGAAQGTHGQPSPSVSSPSMGVPPMGFSANLPHAHAARTPHNDQLPNDALPLAQTRPRKTPAHPPTYVHSAQHTGPQVAASWEAPPTATKVALAAKPTTAQLTTAQTNHRRPLTAAQAARIEPNEPPWSDLV